MARDALSARLMTLVIQANAAATQITLTPVVVDALSTRAVTATHLADRARAASREGFDARQAAMRAEHDLRSAHFDAGDRVQEIAAWRTTLRAELDALPSALRHDAEATRQALRHRPLRAAGTAAWLAKESADLCRRADAFARSPGTEALVAGLRRAPDLERSLAAALASVEAAMKARSEASKRCDVARRELQDTLRAFRAAFRLARVTQPRGVPELDLSDARQAVAEARPRAKRTDGVPIVADGLTVDVDGSSIMIDETANVAHEDAIRIDDGPI